MFILQSSYIVIAMTRLSDTFRRLSRGLYQARSMYTSTLHRQSFSTRDVILFLAVATPLISGALTLRISRTESESELKHDANVQALLNDLAHMLESDQIDISSEECSLRGKVGEELNNGDSIATNKWIADISTKNISCNVETERSYRILTMHLAKCRQAMEFIPQVPPRPASCYLPFVYGAGVSHPEVMQSASSTRCSPWEIVILSVKSSVYFRIQDYYNSYVDRIRPMGIHIS